MPRSPLVDRNSRAGLDSPRIQWVIPIIESNKYDSREATQPRNLAADKHSKANAFNFLGYVPTSHDAT